MAFSEYSDFYDLYYANKDYAAEVDFGLDLAERLGIKPLTLLVLRRGTVRHLQEFIKRNLIHRGPFSSAVILSQDRKCERTVMIK